MAAIAAEIKRGALRTLYRQAQNTGPTPLRDVLDAFQDNGFTSIQGGRLITAHTGAGKAVSFALPQIWQSFTQEEWFSLTEQLQQCYADALTSLGIEDPEDGSKDADIFAAMMADDRLATITSTQKDFSTLRFPTRL